MRVYCLYWSVSVEVVVINVLWKLKLVVAVSDQVIVLCVAVLHQSGSPPHADPHSLVDPSSHLGLLHHDLDPSVTSSSSIKAELPEASGHRDYLAAVTSASAEVERIERAVLDSRPPGSQAPPRSPLESLLPRYQSLQDSRYPAPAYPFPSATAPPPAPLLGSTESTYRASLLSPTGLYPPNTLAPNYLPTSPVLPISSLYYPSSSSSSSSASYQYLHTTSEGRTIELLGASTDTPVTHSSLAVTPSQQMAPRANLPAPSVEQKDPSKQSPPRPDDPVWRPYWIDRQPYWILLELLLIY